MTGLALQIDGKWAVLSEGDSVNIENNSPVWGEGNSFSLPFELDIEANRHILGNADQITGQSVYEVLDGKRAVLYTLGIPVYYGKIKMEDEVELSEGKVDVTLVSGNLTFDEMIDGMNCQDVELLDRIVIGEGLEYCVFYDVDDPIHSNPYKAYFPEEAMSMKVDGVSTINVGNPYPIAKYCNVRICYPKPEKPESPNRASLAYADTESAALQEMDIKDEDKYIVLDADRPLSGMCFFVLYFLDCLFGKLGVYFNNSGLSKVEDLNRLAFFRTKCSYKLETSGSFDVNVLGDYKKFQAIVPTFRWSPDGGYDDFKFYKCLYLADSKNFPDTEVSELVNSLKNAFGIRFIYDQHSNQMKSLFVRDILNDDDVLSITAFECHEVYKIENRIDGFRVVYSGSDEDNTSFNYKKWENVELNKAYADIKNEVYSFNKTLYIDQKTGDAYRVKVDEEAKTEEELNPSLFEVAEFNPAEYGDCTLEENTEVVEIGFSPVIPNDVTPDSDEQTFAIFLDVDMQYPSMIPQVMYDWKGWLGSGANPYGFAYSFFSAQQNGGGSYSTAGVLNLKSEETGNNIRDYDTGLSLGIMRGPGREAGVEDVEQNYDGEGNFKYYMVSQDYTFHSDYIDNYGNLFDYNGTEPGGVDTSGRFSLKLRAEKPNPEGGFYSITETYAQRRGLFDKFYSEYAYFVVNRKIVRMKCRMEMADLLNIDWTKRYKIGEYVGFINKYSYSVSSTGISDVELEMYYI